MSIWSFVLNNPEMVADGATLLLGALGVKAWRTKASKSTARGVDQWASTAVGVVVLLVRTGRIVDDSAAIERFLEELRELAEAAGVELSPEHEHRALASAKKMIAAVGVGAVDAEAHKLAGLVEGFKARMAKLPWPK